MSAQKKIQKFVLTQRALTHCSYLVSMLSQAFAALSLSFAVVASNGMDLSSYKQPRGKVKDKYSMSLKLPNHSRNVTLSIFIKTVLFVFCLRSCPSVLPCIFFSPNSCS
ncbi:hypothetical protein VCRA2117O37_100186 [Vibrio crassostreae]|nr:hypothetical protein VCRA2117O37_100186 [Vibrio crassostreae]CAK2236190.1 hypothetical protein VCRA2119O47_70194 [Vibrio crassostreae]CAK2238389.1 hypothetical protein VCRA2118O41_70188 [Vibrio crassostreae]CAK2582705.1 hypothetical protein VCRA2125O82_100197 [Vibrio crassostreae]CAK4021180.1 hypothetical protein VCRA2125O81_90187 [Vibrio crassostreae]